jgi:hypothetical protein
MINRIINASINTFILMVITVFTVATIYGFATIIWILFS